MSIEFTRDALCVAIKPKTNSSDVLDALYSVPLQNVFRDHSLSDNGAELLAVAPQDWLRKVRIKPIQI
ncbi:MAG: hypothetical protein KJN60_01255 [Boseongicola sp.]|nr:hypothetical protein [Boseongicola sp.]